MKKKVFTVCTIWLILLCISLFGNIKSARDNQQALLFKTAKTLFEQVVITRNWNALQNGVYVKASENTPPNEYLDDPQRDLLVPPEFHLTKINPAYMTRLISELTGQKSGAQFHMTSLKPIRPANSPDEWEKIALIEFNEGKTAAKKQFFKPGTTQPFYRYMAPLPVEESCLACHVEQQYKPGDIIGGISIKILDIPKIELLPIMLSHLSIGVFVLFLIFFYGQKLIKAYDTIRIQAIYDPLTKIPNRRYFNDRIQEEFERSMRNDDPLSIIMADIDHFKNYNDYYGHDQGDLCLIQVAQTIRNVLNRPADFCARYGGEEFIIILPDTGINGATHMATKLINAMKTLEMAHEDSVTKNYVTLSLGICSEKEMKSNVNYIVTKADQALYQAKANGRNRFEIYDT